MQTPEFEAGLDRLRALADEGTVALMCAEAVPWRCHRSLVADALVARGTHVEHISAAARATPHRMAPFAAVRGGHVTYPGDGDEDDGVGLATSAPFHLEATVRVLQRRPTNRVDVWQQGRYLRAFATARGLLQIEVANRGTIDAPDVRYRVRHGQLSRALRGGIERTLRNMLGLELDPQPLQRLARTDRRLAPIGLALRGMRPPRFAGLFEAFANVVPFQQVSLDAGVAIVARLVERFGARVGQGEGDAYAFPPAEAIGAASIAALRACGLSARKAESLRHLARAVASGELSEAMIESLGTDDALQLLGALPGIGPWSASLVLLRGFGRLDVFPPGDVGVARGLSALLHLPSQAALDRLVARAGDQRGYLYFCSLGGAVLAKDLIHAAPTEQRDPLLRSS
jgi:DNA-3-methyladenine glycosylase II